MFLLSLSCSLTSDSCRKLISFLLSLLARRVLSVKFADDHVSSCFMRVRHFASFTKRSFGNVIDTC